MPLSAPTHFHPTSLSLNSPPLFLPGPILRQKTCTGQAPSKCAGLLSAYSSATAGETNNHQTDKVPSRCLAGLWSRALSLSHTLHSYLALLHLFIAPLPASAIYRSRIHPWLCYLLRLGPVIYFPFFQLPSNILKYALCLLTLGPAQATWHFQHQRKPKKTSRGRSEGPSAAPVREAQHGMVLRSTNCIGR